MPTRQDYSQLASGKPMASMGIRVSTPDFKKIKRNLIALDSGIFHLILLALPEKNILVCLTVIQCHFKCRRKNKLAEGWDVAIYIKVITEEPVQSLISQTIPHENGFLLSLIKVFIFL